MSNSIHPSTAALFRFLWLLDGVAYHRMLVAAPLHAGLDSDAN